MRWLAFALLCSWSANAQWSVAPAPVNVGVGYELETLGELTNASVTRVSGVRVSLRFEGVEVERDRLTLTFGAGWVTMDPHVVFGGSELGLAPNISTAAASFRKVGGTAGQVRLALGSSGVFSLQGSVGTFDSDREKELWSWRAAELRGHAEHRWRLTPSLELEGNVGVGVSVGGVELWGLAALERALGLDHPSDEAVTLDPGVRGHLVLRGGAWSLGLKALAGQRVDITPQRSHHQGHLVDAQSQLGRADLVATWTPWQEPGSARSLTVFAELGVEYDNLTVIRMVFGTTDAFIAAQSMLGVRGHF
jgi:hypothetical protein